MKAKKKNGSVEGYNKWGYIFLIPFAAVFIIFQLIPLISTVYYSFFENYMSGLKHIGPTFSGFENFKNIILQGYFLKYFKNTMIM